ncbi:MAG: ABC transporter ATP-binding protein [Eubacterium sp.]|nr:ABC transporter ATP-binding protein [Eubacterium sp.]
MDSILTTKSIYRSFPVGGGELTVLTDINIEMPKGKLIIIKGRSGSGKTTLLNILSALDPASSGEVFFRARKDKNGRKGKASAGPSAAVESPGTSGERGEASEAAGPLPDEEYETIAYSGLSDAERDRLRRFHMGFVFQSVALIPIMTAYENVDFGLRTAGFRGNRDERIRESLASVGLAERMNHMPTQLSGGEQQRVAIARAMAHRPEIIFADEPTGALDTAAGLAVTQLFKDMAMREGITVVMTTHDPGLMELGDVVYEIEDGQIG